MYRQVQVARVCMVARDVVVLSISAGNRLRRSIVRLDEHRLAAAIDEDLEAAAVNIDPPHRACML